MEELYEEEKWTQVSPTGQYLNSSVLSLTIVAVLEFQVPMQDLPTLSMLNTLFLPITPRFSSVMVGGKNGEKKWRKVEVNIKNHVKVPIYPTGKSPEYYQNYLSDYLSKISLEPLPEHQPLWEVHLLPFPTTNAAGNLIFKLHHALGDGYSLIGALLSCLKRADNPSLPLTFPSGRLSSNYSKSRNDIKSMVKRVPQVSSWIVNSVRDFGWSVLKSSVLQDDLSPILSGDIGVELHPMNISTMEFSMDHIKQIKTSLKVTLNDVITGVILLGTRVYMEGESKNSGNTSTNALVLLNTRNLEGYKSISEMVKPKASMPWGNHFAFLHLPLPKLSSTNTAPVQVINPLEFVFATHHIIKRKKNNAAAFLIGGLLDHVRKIRGPESTASYIRKTMTNSSMGISNLIGPVEQMTLSNHPISGLYFAVAGVPQSVQVTVLSYAGKLRICIVVEKDFIDSDKFKACIENAFDTMFKAAVSSRN